MAVRTTTDRASACVVPFENLGRGDIPRVGGKGANLGEMTRAGLPVPRGFVITIDGYARAVRQSGLAGTIAAELSALDVNDNAALQRASERLRDTVARMAVPDDLREEVREAYAELGSGSDPAPLVAVRSSATAEDTAEHSFAGMFESFLNVRGENALLEQVKRCWASTFGARVLFYRIKRGFPADMPVAVVVQRMVDSEKSGVMFTADPATGDRGRIVIEAAWGLGEVVVQGSVTPDHYVLDKSSLAVVDERIGEKEFMLALDRERKATVRIELAGDARARARVLDAAELRFLGELALRAERHYGVPQDLEFAYEGSIAYLTQTRPITTLVRRAAPAAPAATPADVVSPDATPPEAASPVAESPDAIPPGAESSGAGSPVAASPEASVTAGARQQPAAAAAGRPLVRGLGASPGRVTGATRVLATTAEASALERGEILVTTTTSPDWVPTMRLATAIVTETGGMTSHAAIVSRELGIPCIVGARGAMRVLATGTVVTVDGSTGVVVAGGDGGTQPHEAPRGGGEIAEREPRAAPAPITATRIYVNLAQAERIDEIAARDVDGVGLLRAEFMMLDALERTHPRAFLAAGRGEEFVERMHERLLLFARAFAPRPVIYRAMDFRSNEFRGLAQGEQFEPREENPMIGYRGCFRYTREPDLFRLELQALAAVRSESPNLHLMIPFVRTRWELAACMRLIDDSPLGDDRSLERWVMAEVPSVTYWLPAYASLGVSGVSIGSNDLTQLVLGVDRDGELVAPLFDERDEAVKAAIGDIIERSHAAGLTCSICGQAPSVHPDYAEFLVRCGIDSISVNPDAVERTRRNVAMAEQRIVLDAARARRTAPPA